MCYAAKECTMSTLEEFIKESVNESGSIRLNRLFNLVAQHLNKTEGFIIKTDTENHKILTLSNQD